MKENLLRMSHLRGAADSSDNEKDFVPGQCNDNFNMESGCKGLLNQLDRIIKLFRQRLYQSQSQRSPRYLCNCA